jgi:hypothetical protein
VLIEIQGEHTGSITMFGDAAKQLLKMMGQSGQPKGAIRAEDVAGALHQLQASLNQLEEPPVADENEDDNDQVSLKTRAIPLIDLLQTNVEKGGYVMWEPK